MPWYYIDSATEQPVGPLREEEMFRKWRRGKISVETFVWNGKTVKDWKQIKDVPWLVDLARRHQAFHASGERPRRSRGNRRKRSSFTSGNFDQVGSDHGSHQTSRSFVVGQEIVVKRNDNRPERAVVREVNADDIKIQFQEGLPTWIYKHDTRIVSPYIDDDDSDSDSQTPLPSQASTVGNQMTSTSQVLSDTDKQSSRSTDYKRQGSTRSGLQTPNTTGNDSPTRGQYRTKQATIRFSTEHIQRAEDRQQEQDLAEKAARLELERNLFKMEKKQFSIDMDVKTKKYKSQKQMLKVERENFQKEMDSFHRACAKHTPTELDEAVREKSRGEFQSVAELDVNLAYLKQQQDSYARQSRQGSKQLRALSDLEQKLEHSLQEIHYLYERSMLIASNITPLFDEHAKDRNDLRTELSHIKIRIKQRMRSHTVHSTEEIDQEWEKIHSEQRTITRMKSEVAQNVSMINAINEEHSTLDKIREAVRMARESVEEFEHELLDKIKAKLQDQDGYRHEVIELEEKLIALQTREEDLTDRIRHFEQDQRQFQADRAKWESDKQDLIERNNNAKNEQNREIERMKEKLMEQARELRDEREIFDEQMRRFEQRKLKHQEEMNNHSSSGGSVSAHIFEQLQNRLMDSQARLSDLIKESTTAQVELNGVRRENTTLQQNFDRVRQDLRTAETEKRHAEQRINSLIEEKTRIETQQQLTETRLDAIETEKTQLEATKQRLESQLAIVQKHNQRLKVQIEAFKEQSAQMTSPSGGNPPRSQTFGPHARKASNMSLSLEPPVFNGVPRRAPSSRTSITSIDSFLLESDNGTPPPIMDTSSQSGDLQREPSQLDLAFDSLMQGIISRRSELKMHEQTILGQMNALSDAGDEYDRQPPPVLPSPTDLVSRSADTLRYYQRERPRVSPFDAGHERSFSQSGTIVLHGSSSDLGFDTPTEDAYPRFNSPFPKRRARDDSGGSDHPDLRRVPSIDLEDEEGNSDSEIDKNEMDVGALRNIYGSGSILHLRNDSSSPPLQAPSDSLTKPDTPRKKAQSNNGPQSPENLNDLYESPREPFTEEPAEVNDVNPEAEGHVQEVREVYRKRLVQIYREKNPRKLDSVNNLLDKYVGKEHKLYVEVCRKYKMKPLPQWQRGRKKKK